MKNEKPLKLLLVEDIPADAELAERSLRRGGFEIDSMLVETEEAMSAALRDFGPDIVISDYSMPSFDGMSALKLAKSIDPLLPFIVLTGSMNEDTAVECMKAGASDYVIKEHMTRLPFAVREALERRRAIIASAESEKLLRESESRYRAFFEHSNAVNLILDPQDGRILEVNQAACDFYGWTCERLLGMRIGEISMRPEAEILGEMMQVAGGSGRELLFRHRKADGTLVDVEVLTGPIVLEGRTRLFSIIHDVSARVAAEREREELASRLDHYLSTSPTVTYSLRIKDGKAVWQWASENIRELLGFSLQEALASDWWLRNVHAADRLRALGGISKLTSKGVYAQEYRFHRKDRSVVWLRDEMRLESAGEAEVVGTLTDISDRRKVESELSLKSLALEAAANAILITDREGTIRWVNQAFERLTGYSREEAIGENPRILKSGVQGLGFYSAIWETILGGKVWSGEIINKKKSGELYTEEMTITPVEGESQNISGFIAIKNDATERQFSRERLEASLAEKEVLLREIHHRVMNNMQLITSLLSLSTSRIDDPVLNYLLGGIARRIVSIAMVHEQFYNSSDLARIDFVLYLHHLADGIGGDLGMPASVVSITSNAEEVLLSLDQAIPAGLTASELIANALKHAYPTGSALGEVRVALRRTRETLELSVRDDGVGLPDDFSADKAESLGMILVQTLAGQLKGKMEFRSRGGTEAILSFPISG